MRGRVSGGVVAVDVLEVFWSRYWMHEKSDRVIGRVRESGGLDIRLCRG